MEENSDQTHSSELIREVGLGVEGHALKTNLFLYLTFPVIPSSLDVTLTCTYLASGGAPTVVTSVAQLPLRLMVKPCPPIKDADYKITISTNKPPVTGKLIPASGTSSGNAAALDVLSLTDICQTILDEHRRPILGGGGK